MRNYYRKLNGAPQGGGKASDLSLAPPVVSDRAHRRILKKTLDGYGRGVVVRGKKPVGDWRAEKGQVTFYYFGNDHATHHCDRVDGEGGAMMRTAELMEEASERMR